MKIDSYDRTEGILLGTAVGDALGLPMECMKPATIQKLEWSKKLKHRFVLERGMWSDDTEHTIMLAQSLIASHGDLETFRNKFAWELRWWLFGFPSGVGMATARSIIKLWLGFSPATSGVFSAGNGTCMRTAIIAAYFPNESMKRRDYTKAQATISHSDPKATIAAIAITELTALLLESEKVPTAEKVIDTIGKVDATQHCEEWSSICRIIQSDLSNRTPFTDFISHIGITPDQGITGYAYHTVPAVIYSGLMHHWDFESVVTEIIQAGGDTDTTAAIASAVCGAYCGATSIPHRWVAGISEWPTDINALKVLANAIHQKTPLRIRAYWSPKLMLRNLFFFCVVLAHGLLRLIPTAIRSGFR